MKPWALTEGPREEGISDDTAPRETTQLLTLHMRTQKASSMQQRFEICGVLQHISDGPECNIDAMGEGNVL